MPLLSKRAQDEGKKSSSSGVDRYLNPSKLEDGSSVRFCLLEENALDFYEVWGALVEDPNKSRPYRFTDDPTPEDIEEALIECLDLLKSQKTSRSKLQNEAHHTHVKTYLKFCNNTQYPGITYDDLMIEKWRFASRVAGSNGAICHKFLEKYWMK